MKPKEANICPNFADKGNSKVPLVGEIQFPLNHTQNHIYIYPFPPQLFLPFQP
jgi:hypothetical protein